MNAPRAALTEHVALPHCAACAPQEMDRFNLLLAVLRRSLTELQRAVKGLAVMSSELEAMSTALLNNQVGGWGVTGGVMGDYRCHKRSALDGELGMLRVQRRGGAQQPGGTSAFQTGGNVIR